MKKLILLLAVSLVLQQNLFSQPAWSPMTPGTNENFTDVYFIDGLTGFACGGFKIYKTVNVGYNWSQFVLPDTTNLQSIRFLNSTTGFACGGRNINQYWSLQHLYKTTNAGATWFKIQEMSGTMTDEVFTDVFPVDSVVYLTKGGYFLQGVTGSIYKSQNYGANFISINFTSSETFSKMSFVNTQTGWVTTSFGTDVPIVTRKVFKTTNGGQNWVMQYRDSIVQNVLISHNFELQFVNQNTGFGLYKNIYSNNDVKFIKTTNGGITWDSTVLPYNYRAMFFANDSLGWIGGSASSLSNIMRTSNGGNNWHISWQSNEIINSIFFVNYSLGFAVGNNGVILRTFTSGLTGVNVLNISAETPSSYSLSQNYPNPFNPTTKIRFSIMSSPLVLGGDLIQLKVYDLMGREVATLVNEKLSPGTYSVNWNASAYPSGVYFYRLQTGSFSDTKRMLMIK